MKSLRLFLGRKPLLILLFVLLVGTSIQVVTPQGRAHADASISISLSDTLQTMDGFGGSGAQLGAYDLQQLPQSTQNQLLDLLFSQTNGIGLSIVRSEVCSGSQYNYDGFECKSFEPQQGVFDWTNDQEEIWLMNQAKQRGVSTFFSTSWSPPAWMKTNNSTIGGTLRSDMYQAYADYLATYVQNYKSRFGIDLYAISPQNEPESESPWPSSQMSGNDLKNFIHNYLKPTFVADNITTKIMTPETAYWGDLNNYIDPILTDPTTRDDVDIIAGHSYDLQYGSVTNAGTKPVWETEISKGADNDPSIANGIEWAKRIHNFISIGASAYLYWQFTSQHCCSNAQYSLINVDPVTGNFTANKRLYTLGNYSLFVRPGYQRLNVTANPANGVYVTAYKDPASSKFVVVAINDNSGDTPLNITSSDFQSDSVTPYVTSDTLNLAAQPAINASGNSFNVSLPAQSVTTYVGTVGSSNTGTGTNTNTSTNLLQDPGFENQTDSTLRNPWSHLEGAGDVGVDYHLNGYPHAGSNDGWINNSANPDQWSSIGQAVSLTANTNYTLSCWERDSGNINGAIGVYYSNSQRGGDHSENTFTGSTGYRQVSQSFNSGSNTSATMYIGYNGTPSSYLVADDCSLSAS